MKVTVTFEFDDGKTRVYVFRQVAEPEVSASAHRTVFKIEPSYFQEPPGLWPAAVLEVPPLRGAQVNLEFYARPDERGEVCRWTERKAPVSATLTMCWACGDMRAVTAEGVFVDHGVNHDGSGDRCRGSGTDGPPEMAECGYCHQLEPFGATGRFGPHIALRNVGGATAGRPCEGSGCAPEETTR
jgi:hypothetical protein